jgi:hypothetical protein
VSASDQYSSQDMVEAGLRTTASMFASIPASGSSWEALHSTLTSSKPVTLGLAPYLGSLTEAGESRSAEHNRAALTGTQSVIVSAMRASPRPKQLAVSLSHQPQAQVGAVPVCVWDMVAHQLIPLHTAFTACTGQHTQHMCTHTSTHAQHPLIAASVSTYQQCQRAAFGAMQRQPALQRLLGVPGSPARSSAGSFGVIGSSSRDFWGPGCSPRFKSVLHVMYCLVTAM